MIKCLRTGNHLTVQLNGEIDHHAASSVRHEIEAILTDRTITSLHLDFANVSFMDSSGIGMIIGRYKTMIARKGKTTAGGVNSTLERVYRLAGLHRIIPLDEDGGKDER